MAAADEEGDRQASLEANDPQLAPSHRAALWEGLQPFNELCQSTDERDSDLLARVLNQVLKELIDILLSLGGVGNDVAHCLDRAASSLIRASKCACASFHGIVSASGLAITLS